MRDRDVREAVRNHLNAIHRGDDTTRIVEEMTVWSGTVRIDIAVINGELSGYELKSDKDTLSRLPLQASVYNRVFDRVTLVVGAKHVKKALPLIPDWWGVLVASACSGGISLEKERINSRNPEQDAILIAELLWKEEAITLLAEHGLERGWKAKRIRFLHQRLAGNLPLETLKTGVRKALKARLNWLGLGRSDEFNVAIHSDPGPMF